MPDPGRVLGRRGIVNIEHCTRAEVEWSSSARHRDYALARYAGSERASLCQLPNKIAGHRVGGCSLRVLCYRERTPAGYGRVVSAKAGLRRLSVWLVVR
jgi:hypothetical protein